MAPRKVLRKLERHMQASSGEKTRIIGFCLMFVVSCGGRVAPTTEVTSEAKADALISYVVGYCTGTPGRPRCGYSREDYQASPCCAPSAEMRANADTYTAY